MMMITNNQIHLFITHSQACLQNIIQSIIQYTSHMSFKDLNVICWFKKKKKKKNVHIWKKDI